MAYIHFLNQTTKTFSTINRTIVHSKTHPQLQQTNFILESYFTNVTYITTSYHKHASLQSSNTKHKKRRIMKLEEQRTNSNSFLTSKFPNHFHEIEFLHLLGPFLSPPPPGKTCCSPVSCPSVPAIFVNLLSFFHPLVQAEVLCLPLILFDEEEVDILSNCLCKLSISF